MGLANGPGAPIRFHTCLGELTHSPISAVHSHAAARRAFPKVSIVLIHDLLSKWHIILAWLKACNLMICVFGPIVLVIYIAGFGIHLSACVVSMKIFDKKVVCSANVEIIWSVNLQYFSLLPFKRLEINKEVFSQYKLTSQDGFLRDMESTSCKITTENKYVVLYAMPSASIKSSAFAILYLAAS